MIAMITKGRAPCMLTGIVHISGSQYHDLLVVLFCVNRRFSVAVWRIVMYNSAEFLGTDLKLEVELII